MGKQWESESDISCKFGKNWQFDMNLVTMATRYHFLSIICEFLIPSNILLHVLNRVVSSLVAEIWTSFQFLICYGLWRLPWIPLNNYMIAEVDLTTTAHFMKFTCICFKASLLWLDISYYGQTVGKWKWHFFKKNGENWWFYVILVAMATRYHFLSIIFEFPICSNIGIHVLNRVVSSLVREIWTFL